MYDLKVSGLYVRAKHSSLMLKNEFFGKKFTIVALVANLIWTLLLWMNVFSFVKTFAGGKIA